MFFCFGLDFSIALLCHHTAATVITITMNKSILTRKETIVLSWLHVHSQVPKCYRQLNTKQMWGQMSAFTVFR